MEVLPDEINRQCLICLPYQDLPTVRSVCKSWKAQIERPEFTRDRKATGHSQNVVVMAQVRVDRDVVTVPFTAPTHRLTVFEPDSGNWRELMAIPGFNGRLPVCCGMVSVGSDLAVIGGWDPDTYESLSCVFLYSFQSGKWRRGADMPGGARSFFGCASDSNRTVYVAGGHDGDKNALRSGLAYDVARDEWVPLPDMARERDECKGGFHRGKFHVIGGFGTEMQGKFGRCAESFDATTWRWGPVEEDFLSANKCPSNCVSGADGAMYTCHKGDVVVSRDNKWEVVVKLPDEVCNTSTVMTWQNNLFLMGSTGPGEAHMAYVLNLSELTWTKLKTPRTCTGYVLSACCLVI